MDMEKNEYHLSPVHVLGDGNGDGKSGKGFKDEWMVRDFTNPGRPELTVGGLGKEWTSAGDGQVVESRDPIRVSKDAYDEDLDEKRGGNLLLLVDVESKEVRVVPIGGRWEGKDKTRGFSSSLKTTEFEGHVELFITVIGDDGTVVLEEESV
eukprot:Nk52_evm9s2273 gene=Nk52_evmTU9s2273